MTHSEQTVRGEVEQVDREAAAEYLQALYADYGDDAAFFVHALSASNTRQGKNDHAKLVQAFARHRLASLSPADNGEAPCRHEWYQGQCVHCEIPVKEYRAALSTTPDAVRGEVLDAIEPCPSCGALPCDWVNSPHHVVLSGENAEKDRAVDTAQALGLTAEDFTSYAADILLGAFSRCRREVVASIARWLRTDPDIPYKIGPAITKDALCRDIAAEIERTALATLHPSPEAPIEGQDVEALKEEVQNAFAAGWDAYRSGKGFYGAQEQYLSSLAALRAPVERKGEASIPDQSGEKD